MKKRWKRWFLLGAVLFAALILGAYVILPGLVDSRMNRVYTTKPPEPSAAARTLHKNLFVADLHADTLLWGRDLLVRGTSGHVDVPRLIEGNVALQAFTVVTKVPRNMNYDKNTGGTDDITLLAVAEGWPPATWSSLLERALYQSRRLHESVNRSGGTLQLIESQKDLAEFLERRKADPHLVGCFLGIEGLHCLEGKLENVDVLYDAGFRMMGLTHFFDNAVGGSAHGVKKGGLTDFGKSVVQRLEERKILIDLAHASPKLVDDVLAIATRPVISSHTGVKGTCDRGRNLSDEQVRGIAETGGLVGIGYWDEAVCGQDVTSIAAAIQYAVDIAGVDHVALGSDFDGATTVPFDASGLVAITDALLDAGVSEEDIAKVMGGNVKRLLMQILPPA